MKIREPVERDYAGVVRLLRQLNPEDLSVQDSVRRAVFDQIIGTENLVLVVAEIDSHLVGTCYLNVIPNLTRGASPYAVIENVVTDSAYRQRGVGKAIIDFAVNRAWSAECYKVMLMTGRKDDAVFRFYTRCGFSANQKQAFVHRAR